MEKRKLSTILHSIKTGGFRVSSFQETLFYLLEREEGKYIIEALLQAEADISTQTSGSSAPEQMDTKNTHKHIVQLFINLAENCNFYDNSKKTVLHYASEYGWTEVVQSLLKKGADPNVKETDGYTPLIFATQGLHKNIVDLLIESGADVLCHNNVNYTLLHAASEKGWLEFVQFLLNKGVDPNTATNSGFTPLDFAARAPHKEVVVLLVDSGANVISCKSRGGTILRCATKGGHLQVLQYLIENAGPIRCRMSPLLDTACSYEQIETIEYLVKVLNMMNGCDDSPLKFIIANYRPNLKLVKIFIERGAYLDFYEYDRVLIHRSLNVDILQNIQICTQAIINKYNNKDLPDLFKLPMSVETLPPIKNLMINSQGIIQGIEESVRSEIETRGHCNLMKPRVILLSMMSVKSYIDYYEGIKKKSQLKRLATGDSDDQFRSPQKIRCLDCSAYFNEESVGHFPHQC